MKPDYLKFVRWSDEDQVFIGHCPDLFLGGVCHGTDEMRVYRQLSRLVSDEIAAAKKARRALPARNAQVMLPAYV